MQTAIFIDCVERYQARYMGQIAAIIPELIRLKTIETAKPMADLVNLMIEKEASPYGYASMMVCTIYRHCIEFSGNEMQRD